jgi:hypothetical protein
MSEEIKELIMSKVQIDGETGCWNWTGALYSWGAPRLRVGKKPTNIKKYLFGIYYGEVFDMNIQMTMSCNNKLCVCPDHIVLITAGSITSESNKQKTHCKQGHSLEGAYISKKGHRYCRTCRNISSAKIYKNRGKKKNNDTL